jgi:hypothetical protein
MPLPTTFAGDSARAEGLFASTISLGANYWVAILTPANTAGFPITMGDGVAVDSSGNVYVCGQGLNAAGFNVQSISKWNSSGVLQWQRTLTDPYSSPADSAYNIAVDSSGNVYVCGQGLTAANVNVQSISKWDSSGTIQWQRTLNSAGAYKTQTDASYGIYVDSSANVYVCGQGADGSGNGILSISKWDSSGTLQFQKKLVGSSVSLQGKGITLDSSGNIYVCGQTQGRVFISKWDSSGTLQWQTSVINAGSVAGAYGNATILDSSGNVYVAGGGQNSAGFNVQFIAKWNSSGVLQWQRTLTPTNSSPSAGANGIYVDSANYVYVCGNGTNASAANVQSISKWDSSGTIQWQRTLAASTPSDSAVNIFVDSSGSMYVVGRLQSNAGIGVISIAKLPTDGSRTGTYSNSDFGFTYASSSWTAATSTWTSTTPTYTASTSTWTSATSTWTAATSTWTPSTISV